MSFPVIPIPPFFHQQKQQYRVKNEVISYTSPDSLACQETTNSVLVQPTRRIEDQEQCVICCDSLLFSRGYSRDYAGESTVASSINSKELSDLVELRQCGHCFHRSCISVSLAQHEPKCPICRTNVKAPAGKSPSGTMSIRIRNDVVCPGFRYGTKTISILYTIPSGCQKSYHVNPGQPFGGTKRVAYIPNSNEGRELLTRLVYAFQHGLTFTVGTSITTGRDNVVTWTSIHHKTRLDGGPYVYGFPDENYLDNCHESLDALGVPSADKIVRGETCEEPKASRNSPTKRTLVPSAPY